MTIEEALTSYLLADGGLTALIGQRLYPADAVPQAKTPTYPVLTYRQVGSNPVHYLTGGRSNLERDTFEVEAHSPDRLACGQVRDYLRGMLSGTAARGVWGGGGGLSVRACLFEDAYAADESPADGSEKRPRTLRANLTVIWQR